MTTIRLLAIGSMAAFVVLAARRPTIMFCRRLGLADQPIWRSLHIHSALRGGGLAVVLGVCASVSLASLFVDFPKERMLLWIAVPLTLGAVGLLDDKFNLPASPRLGAQLLCGTGVAWWTVDQGGSFSIAFGAGLFLVVVVNALNFIDGIDCLAVVVAVAIGSGGLLASLQVGALPEAAAFAATIGSCLAFTRLNRANPKLFLGDIGSYAIASFLAVVSVTAIVSKQADAGPTLAGWAFVLADVGISLVLRIGERANLGEGHCDHAYQRLVRQGRKHLVVTAFSGVVSAAMVAFSSVVHFVAQPEDRAFTVGSTFSLFVALCVGFVIVGWIRKITQAIPGVVPRPSDDGDGTENLNKTKSKLAQTESNPC